MNGADYLIIAILAISMLLGFFRGFLKESIALIAWLGGLWLAWKFAYLVTPYLGGLLAEEPIRTWVARSLVLIAVVLMGWLVSAILSHFVHQSGLSLMLDRMLGTVFGFVRGGVLVAVFVIIGQLVEVDGERWWRESWLLPYASDVAGWVRQFAEAGATYLDEQQTMQTEA